jgi:hypothetical protein
MAQLIYQITCITPPPPSYIMYRYLHFSNNTHEIEWNPQLLAREFQSKGFQSTYTYSRIQKLRKIIYEQIFSNKKFVFEHFYWRQEIDLLELLMMNN